MYVCVYYNICDASVCLLVIALIPRGRSEDEILMQQCQWLPGLTQHAAAL